MRCALVTGVQTCALPILPCVVTVPDRSETVPSSAVSAVEDAAPILTRSAACSPVSAVILAAVTVPSSGTPPSPDGRLPTLILPPAAVAALPASLPQTPIQVSSQIGSAHV